MKTKQNDGSYLQDELAAALKTFCEYNPAYWHRFPDTKSARGMYLKSQPGDFMFLVCGTSALIECKSSVVKAKLVTLAWHGEVGKRQIAKHRLWLRSGNPSFYLYGDLQDRRFEWHRGCSIVNKRNEPILSGSFGELPESLSKLVILLDSKELLRANDV